MIKVKFTWCETGEHPIITTEVDSPVPFNIGDKIKHYHSEIYSELEVVDTEWVIDDVDEVFYQNVSVKS